MAILGVDILKRVMRTLNDPNNVRWKMDELLDWLNDGQREIAILRPDSSTAVVVFALTAGSTLQSIPAITNGLRVIDITRNMGTDGTTPGAPIRLAVRDDMDLYKPTWHQDAATASIQNWIYDGRSPKNFYVYPRPSNSVNVEAHLVISPTDVTIATVAGGLSDSLIALDDLYQTALFDYVCYRALAKNTDAKNDSEALRGYQAFLNRLGLKLQTDRSFDPHRNSPPTEPKRERNRADTAL